MDADGHKSGFDNPLNSQVSTMLSIPVIASGGGGTLEHFRDAIKVGKADAVLAASVFHYGTYNVSEVKQFLRTSGIPVRL
jgi:cyclase